MLVRTLSSALLFSAVLYAAEPPDALEHARRSYELAKSGDLGGAAEAMETASRLAPHNSLYVSGLGGILARQGKLAESKECFRRAVELDGTNPAFRFQLATRQWESGELEAARTNLIEALRLRPEYSDAAAMLELVSLDFGAVLAREGRFKAGLALAIETAGLYPKSAKAQQMLGLFQTRNQQNVLAVETYKRAKELAPDRSDVNVALAVAQSQAGLLHDAATTFEQGLGKWPEDPVHHQAYGVLLLRLAETDPGLQDSALKKLRRAIELNPALGEAHYQLGNLALARGDALPAIEHLQAALRAGEIGGKVHYALYRAYRMSGKPDLAAEHLALFGRGSQER